MFKVSLSCINEGPFSTQLKGSRNLVFPFNLTSPHLRVVGGVCVVEGGHLVLRGAERDGVAPPRVLLTQLRIALRHCFPLTLQGDTSGCAQGYVDINAQVAF